MHTEVVAQLKKGKGIGGGTNMGAGVGVPRLDEKKDDHLGRMKPQTAVAVGTCDPCMEVSRD